MKHRLPLFVLLAALGGAALAEEYRLGNLVVEDPWAREMPPVSETGAAWVRVVNRGGADRIVSVQSPTAARAGLHTHEMEDGVAKMRHLPSVEVPGQSDVAFEPGARHVMLTGLNAAIVAGETFPMTIRFENAGAIEVLVRVRESGELAQGGLSGQSGHSEDSGQFLDSGDPPEAFA